MDPYEKEQERLRKLLEDTTAENFSESSEEEEEEDPYEDDNGSDVDPDYNISDDSEDDVYVSDEDTLQNSASESDDENFNETRIDKDDEEWTETIRPIPNFQFSEADAGCKLNLDVNSTPRDVFNHIFSHEIVSMILKSTNEYGHALANKNAYKKTRNSRPKNFKPIDEPELLRFFGLSLLRGQIRTPKIRDLFSKNPLYQHPIFPATMSGRRFLQILRCLNVNPDANVKYLSKVQGLVQMFNKNCQSSYGPRKYLSLDESLLLFRGKLHFKQYIKNKRAKYGIKFFELCEYFIVILREIFTTCRYPDYLYKNFRDCQRKKKFKRQL